jgi:tetratricopeptide (TPR) repeat protein
MIIRSRSFVAAAGAALFLVACSRDKSTPSDNPAVTPSVTTPTTATPDNADKIPLTTKNEEARALFEKARKLQLELRTTDAHALFEQAVAKDPELALGHLGVAQTSLTNDAFFVSLDRAVALIDKVSEAEKLMIRGVEAGAKNDPAAQAAAYAKLVEIAPKDPQSWNLHGNMFFGRQEYDTAIASYNKAIAIDDKFTQPYNQLGYAYRFIEKYDDAQRTFEKYIELIPNDPNPHDSYAELLMKRGKFDEAIASYEKAIALDKNFFASYIGIGNAHMFAGRGNNARETFAKMTDIARNAGEKRQALNWTAISYLHESKTDEALAQVDKMSAIAVEIDDLGLLAQDHNFRANILLEADKPDAAAKEFKAQVDTIAKSKLPDEVKEGNRRNSLFNQARVALAKNDVAGAKKLLDEYGTQVAVKKISFEVRLHHELSGLVALAEKRYADAIASLDQANQQDPRVFYLLGVAHAGAGDAAKARAFYQKAHDFNALSPTYAYVRNKAKKALAGS